jgi:hypothetical protein
MESFHFYLPQICLGFPKVIETISLTLGQGVPNLPGDPSPYPGLSVIPVPLARSVDVGEGVREDPSPYNYFSLVTQFKSSGIIGLLTIFSLK